MAPNPSWVCVVFFILSVFGVGWFGFFGWFVGFELPFLLSSEWG